MQRVIDRVWGNMGTFFATFVLVTFFSYGILYVVDFIPEAPIEAGASTTASIVSNGRSGQVAGDNVPHLLIIDKLDKTVPINNPQGADVKTLDESLLTGAVRYPGGADMVEKGTMFLFGHSSHLAVVHNKNFRAFNDIENLEWGDIVRVRSNDTENVYRVQKVYEKKASDTEFVLERTSQKLIMVTCNTFGSKDDRFVVEAVLISSYPIGE